jgi:hypothetical protein
MTTTDRTTEPAGVFDAHLARWEAAEADPDGTVERVARVLWERQYGTVPWDELSPTTPTRTTWRDHAAAAIDALRPAPDAPRDARLTAVLDLADQWEAEAKRHDDAEPINTDGLMRMILAARSCRTHARDLRAAVAAPLAGHDNEDGGR